MLLGIKNIFQEKLIIFLCVSEQMKNDLQNNWNITATTLYDRPIKELKSVLNRNAILAKYNE